MTSLADMIIDGAYSNGSQQDDTSQKYFGNIDLPDIDECGIPTSNTLDYFVARILAYDQLDSDGHLHLRDDGRIWKGDQWVAENSKNLYRIARWGHPIRQYQCEAIWMRIREVLPVFSRDKIKIYGDLVWDKQGSRLIEDNEIKTIN